MYGLSGSFFTNDKVVLGQDSSQRITSPANSREGGATIFTVPEHTIGTQSLFIFVDGKLKLPNIDYVDINSEQVEMNYEVPVEHTFDSILVVSIGEGGANWIEFGEEVAPVESEVNWGGF